MPLKPNNPIAKNNGFLRSPSQRRRIAGIAIVLGLVPLLFFGCLKLSKVTRSWRQPEPPPAVEVDRLIKVRLGGWKPRDSAALEVTAPFTITNSATGRILVQRESRLRQCMVRPASGSGLQIGTIHVNADDVLISPKRDAAIVLDKKTYRGLLRIQCMPGGVVFDNHVDVEAYLRGVLRGELPRYFHPGSFKAQAVAARTYVLYQKRNGRRDRSFDVFDHEGSQMYLGVVGEDRIAVRAVEETAGEVCTWNDGRGDQIFCTYYSSTCGGCSQHVNNVKANEPAVPPLAGGVVCRDCYLAKFYRWDPVTLTKAEVTKRLLARYPSLERLGTIVTVKPKAETADGRIIRVQLVGETGGNETLIGEDFRLSIGGRTLKSTNFVIEDRGDCFVFRNGKGFGHGIGLCQYGMETKARRGVKYVDILTTYYPGAKIKKIY